MKWRGPASWALLLLMEALAVYAVLAWLAAATAEGGKPSLVAVCLVVGGSFGIARVLHSTELPLVLIRVWGTAFSLLVFYAIVRVDFFDDWQFWDFTWADHLVNSFGEVAEGQGAALLAVPLLWVAWLRGLTRGQQAQSFDAILQSFVVGLIAVAVVSVFEGRVDDTPGLVGKVAVPYVLVGLIGIALAHSARTDDQATRGFGGAWLAAIALGVVVMAGVSLLIALFDLSDAASSVGTAGGAVWAAVEPVVKAVLSPLVYALDAAIRGLRDLFVTVFGQPDVLDQQGRPEPIDPEGVDWQFPAWFDALLRVVIASFVLAIVVALLALVFKRFRKTVRPAQSRESAYQEGRLASDLGGLLTALVDRFRPGTGRRSHLDPIRRLYHDVLAEAASRGSLRPEHLTPLEFAPVLEERFASPVPRRISEVFAAARYGGHLPDAESVAGLRQEWQTVLHSLA